MQAMGGKMTDDKVAGESPYQHGPNCWMNVPGCGDGCERRAYLHGYADGIKVRCLDIIRQYIMGRGGQDGHD